MPKALVCINTDPFAAEEVLTEVWACDGVEEAFRVHGVYDIVAKINGESAEAIMEIVAREIEQIRNVQTTHVMLIIDPEKLAQESPPMIV